MDGAMAAMVTHPDALIHELESAAYELATGRPHHRDLGALLREMVSLPLRSGMSLLAVLVATAPRVDESPAARRQFFHAARAFVSLHRA